jgi:hypothetical protein
VNQESRDEIAASLAAHNELGPRYDDAVAEGLVDRIGEEIDKRVEARLRGLGAPGGQAPYGGQGLYAGQGGPQPYSYVPGPAVPMSPAPAPVPAAQHRSGTPGVVLGLGSIAVAAGVTSSVMSSTTASVAKVFIALLIWMAIAVVNIAFSRRR